MYREFEVPDEQVFVESLGVVAESLEGEDARALNFADVTGEDLSFSYSVTGRSIRLLWRNETRMLMDVLREGATRLQVRTEGRSTRLEVEYQIEGAAGVLEVQIFPSVNVKDHLLLS